METLNPDDYAVVIDNGTYQTIGTTRVVIRNGKVIVLLSNLGK